MIKYFRCAVDDRIQQVGRRIGHGLVFEVQCGFHEHVFRQDR